jgi:DNA polymerase-3 subunit gamma/tau
LAYVSLYRKYRSQTFSDLVGQDHVVKTLQNGISSGKIGHSYLFTGPRGTGKTSTARLLAKALCCEHGPIPEPDNTCEICKSITTGSCIDVVEMDAASESGVDDIREQIVEAVEYRPMMCRYKIFIIDEVHDLSPRAFDALLKTIEEPPAHVVFILATTEYNKVPPTVRSRCQKHEFRRAGIQDLTGRLEYVLKEEGVEADPAAVAAIARMADGGYRDALTLLEQAILVSDGHIGLEEVYDQLGLVAEDAIDGIFRSIQQQDVPTLIGQLDQINREGKDARAILESMMYRLADLTRASFNVQDRNLDPARDASLHETAVVIGRDLILRLRTDVAEAHKLIRDISLPRIWLESRLVALASVRTKQPARASEVPTAPQSPPPASPTNGHLKKETRVPEPSQPPAVPVEPNPTPELSGDPKLDEAILAWQRCKADLGEVSATLRNRLSTAVAIARDGFTVTIQVERHGDRDWIVEDKKKPGQKILQVFRSHFGPEAELQYVVKKKASGPEEPNAVELPIEGKLLEETIKQLFQQ